MHPIDVTLLGSSSGTEQSGDDGGEDRKYSTQAISQKSLTSLYKTWSLKRQVVVIWLGEA